jgi:uncharacterized membrane protein (UPF0127 family)
MHIFITYKTLNLIKNLFCIAIILSSFSCKTNDDASTQLIRKASPHRQDLFSELRKGQIALPSGRMLKVKLAITPTETTKGLSGIQDSDYDPFNGLLFFFKENGPRSFWMPDTYFNLDIIFLDENLKIVDIDRNVPHHPGRVEPIPRAKTVFSRHVLEIKSSSPLSQDFQVGQKLNWVGQLKWLQTQTMINKKLSY